MHLWLTILVLFYLPYLEGFPSETNLFPRVVGGNNAKEHSWPWQISLRIGNDWHTCGGSLITPNWVLTAAHCVDKDPTPSRYTVVVGAHRRTETTIHEVRHSVEKVIYHADYSPRNLRNDVALLKLAKPVQIKEQVNIVRLPTAGSRVQPGTECFITGWGRTVGGQRSSSADYLQEAKLSVAGFRECTEKNGRTVHDTSMLCAGEKGSGGCHGDSGGPFVCEEGGSFVLRGISSWVIGTCSTEHYTVFARVSSFINWINEKSGAGNCEVGWQKFKSSCYYFSLASEKTDRHSAHQNCINLGAKLAAIKSKEENSFIYSHISGDTWFGMSDEASEGNWVFELDGSAAVYKNWHSGEPNGGSSENYGSMWSDGTWDDAYPNKDFFYVCQKAS